MTVQTVEIDFKQFLKKILYEEMQCRETKNVNSGLLSEFTSNH